MEYLSGVEISGNKAGEAGRGLDHDRLHPSYHIYFILKKVPMESCQKEERYAHVCSAERQLLPQSRIWRQDRRSRPGAESETMTAVAVKKGERPEFCGI